MDEGLKDFSRRYRDIQRKHRRLARGYYTRIGKNGVIEHVPLRPQRSGSLLAPALVVLGAVLCFKVLMSAHLGPETYGRHLDALAAGNAGERLGALVLAPDPLTDAAARMLAPLF